MVYKLKKIISLFLTAVLVLALAGCSGNSNGSSNLSTINENSSSQNSSNISKDNTGKISVVVSIFPAYDFSREIAGDKAELTLLLPPGSESHSYEPTPQDIITIQNCDVFIYVGGESDVWVDKILESMDTSNMKILKMMDMVDVVEEEIVEGMEGDEHDHGTSDEDHNHEEDQDVHSSDVDHEEDAEYDEHVWTSVRNSQLIVQSISDTFCDIDSENKELYKSNTAAYIEELNELDKEFEEVVSKSKYNTIVFGDRFPLRYFADDYGLTYYAAFPGCSSETEASASTVAFLIDTIEELGLPVVFHIEFSNERMADAISESTGAKSLLFHSCHNVSKDDIEAGVGYIDLMKQNVINLEEALN